MGYLTYAIYAILLYFGIWFFRLFYRQRKFPRGPVPYPFVGNLPTLGKEMHRKLDQLATDYGPIFTLWFARTPIVIVSDAQAAEEVFARNGSKFSDRPTFINKVITKRANRLPYMNYCPEFERKQNICAKSCLVDSQYLDDVLIKVLSGTRKVFENKITKKSFQPSDTLKDLVMQTMSELIYGLPMSSAKFADFNLPGNHGVFSLINATTMFRSLRLFRPGPYIKFKKYLHHREKVLQDIFNESVEECKNKRTILSSIVNNVNEQKDDSNLYQSELLCSDLFLVSIEKMAATLDWMFLYFITWPEIQHHVYEEIRTSKLRDPNQVTIEEANRIPYLRAAVYETLRLSSLSPLSTVHKTNDHVTLKGHPLPKGTCVCVNLNAIHHSVKYWDEPYQFNPARFLEGNSLKDITAIKGFFPFGQGLRKCFGEELTLQVLTTIIANLMLHFNFDVSPWHLRPSLSGTSRLILVPQVYHVSITQR
eukprot:TCONS_00026011-protein